VKPAILDPTAPAPRTDWPDGFVRRLAALARLQTLNAELLSEDSATAVLQRWCDLYGGQPGLKVRARLEPGAGKTAPDAVRRELQVGPDAALAYRRVALTCGELVLSRADNWYRPDRLSNEMNQRLTATDVPFGVIVASLGYYRRTLAALPLVEILPPGWAVQPPQANAEPLVLPDHVLEHRAVLTTHSGAPISLVIETYARALIDNV
jgi:chorismate-pyruvate lyase